MVEKDYYKILNVDPNASQEVIHAAYLNLTKHYHPNINHSFESKFPMLDIYNAYNILKNPETRKAYDDIRFMEAYSASQSKEQDTQEEIYDFWQTTKTCENDAQEKIIYPQDPEDNISWCQCCGDIAPTKNVRLFQNIGAIVVHFTRNTDGYLCRECIENYFWRYTAITLTLGWWGIRSFFCAGCFLVINLFTYLSSLNLKKPGVSMVGKAAGWKVLTMMALCAIGYILFLRFSPESRRQESIAQPTSTVINKHVSQPTLAPTVQPTRSHNSASSSGSVQSNTNANHDDECYLWSNITLRDVGEEMCVYGKARDAYETEQAFFITFSSQPQSFYLLSYDYAYMDIENKCVAAMGTVEKLGQAPVIVIGNQNLYSCNW